MSAQIMDLGDIMAQILFMIAAQCQTGEKCTINSIGCMFWVHVPKQQATIKVEYHVNENPLKDSEKNNICWS